MSTSQKVLIVAANFVGATIGLGWTSAVVAVAGWCGNHYGSDASEARAVLGVGLAVLSLVGKYTSDRADSSWYTT